MAKYKQDCKVLFVHAGGTKTGTSALQNFLEMERVQLNRFGLSYENRCGIRSAQEITSGNGAPLYVMLRDAESTDNDVERMILSYFNGTRRAICSCEGFQELDPKSWMRLTQASQNLGVRLELIFYVRNVMPFFWSSYDQVIKRHGECRPFAQWATQTSWDHGTSLRTIATQIPVQDIHVIWYDERPDSIFESFLNVIEIDATFKVEAIYKTTKVNRSLTKQEREALKFANSVLGQTYTRELSDLLIYSNPSATSEPVFVSKRVIKLLFDRFASDVNWVNETFFGGKEVVAVLPIKGVQARGNDKRYVKGSTPLDRNISDKLSFFWAVNKLGATKADVERLTMDLLNTVAMRYWQQTHPDLPTDFNVLAYLTRNPDVLFSGVDPIQHYLVNGKSEGRMYKYGPTTNLCSQTEG